MVKSDNNQSNNNPGNDLGKIDREKKTETRKPSKTKYFCSNISNIKAI
jgi:hypothetical protein